MTNETAPMTDEQIAEYVERLRGELDSEGNLTDAGQEMIRNGLETISEADQNLILSTLQESVQNANEATDEGSEVEEVQPTEEAVACDQAPAEEGSDA